MVSDDQNHRQIARNLKINWQIALKGRNRWLQTNNQELSIFPTLQDSERIGVTVKFSMEQVIELLAYTPKHSWWLNQVEIWFSNLVRKLLKRASFISQDDLKQDLRKQ